MSEMLSEPIRSACDRLVAEFYRWLPATVMFLFYAVSGSMVYFTFAVALILGVAVTAVHRD